MASTLNDDLVVTGSLSCPSIGTAVAGDVTVAEGANRSITLAGNADNNATAAKTLTIAGSAKSNVSASGTGGPLALVAGAAAGSGAGGAATLTGGASATGAGGAVTIAGGAATAGTGNGGAVVINGGATTGGTAGAITIGTVGSSVTITPATTVSGTLTVTGGLVTPGVSSSLTAGTMTQVLVGQLRYTWSRYDWTNAMVAALGASTTGDITVCTLPAKTIVRRALVVINTPDTSTNALTVAVGTASATYLDYVVASDAKAAANTVYGDAIAEVGTNLSHIVNTSEQTPMDHLPSWTGTTAVKAHFIKTTTNLSTVLGSTGSVYLETAILP